VVNITYFSVFFLAFYQEKEKIRQIAWGIACLRKEETGKGIFI
jgi:hypothetical protein